MKPITVIFVVLFAASCSCMKKKPAAETAAAKPQPAATEVKGAAIEKNETAEQYRFIVSFISIGGGTDFKAHQAYQRFISDFNKGRKDTLVVERTPWGREGEVDYCHKLGELSPGEQLKFIEGVKSVLKESSLVRYKENAPCRKKREEE